MARYFTELTFAPNAFSAFIQNPQDRAQAVRPSIEKLGGKLVDYYFAVGHNTVYSITEVPDEIGVEAFTMVLMASGAVTSIKSVAILTAAEAVEAMKQAGALAYRPPTS